MRLGSLFSGIGTLDLAVEQALGVTTAWQLDQVGAAVRRRHWPEALQVEGDVRAVDPLSLPPVDVLCGGFPCQDLSCAGSGAGLEGERSGLYREVLRFVRTLQSSMVVLENVPALLTRYREQLERDFGRLGYGLTWVRARAMDAGAPHLRRRVFVVAHRGAVGRGVLDAPRGGAWAGDCWPTPTAKGNHNRAGLSPTSGDGLATAVRLWPTPAASMPNEGEDPASCQARRDAIVARGQRPPGEPLGQAVRTWATPRASDSRSAGESRARAGREDTICLQVRTWATPLARDAKGIGGSPKLQGGEDLQAGGKRLRPEWVEALIGLPMGWTLPDGPSQHTEALSLTRWPRGRYPEGWDRSQRWPGHDWEPSRTLPDGPPARGRPARIKGLGNAVVWRCAVLALSAALQVRPAQLGLLDSTSHGLGEMNANTGARASTFAFTRSAAYSVKVSGIAAGDKTPPTGQ